jgi:hypothetical protein
MIMITQEEILAQLKLERDKISPLKQVTDRYLEEKAKRLFGRVTEETVLTDLIADTIEDIKDTQLTINSVLAEEAKKNPKKETKTETKPKEVETQTQTQIPDEIKEFMESWKAEQKQKAIAAKKQQIFEAAKTKFNENQIPILKTVVEKFNFDFEQTDDVLLQTVITETTNFIKNTIGDITPQNPNNTQTNSNEEKIKKIQEIAKKTLN